MEALPAIVLWPDGGARPFEASRRESDLPGVAHLWSVASLLPPGRLHRQEVLSLPAFNLSVELVGGVRRSWVHGPVTERFERVLTPGERTVAAQFTPGRFPVPTLVAAADLVDRRVPAGEVDPRWAGLDGVASLDGLAAVLGSRLTEPSSDGLLVGAAVRTAAEDRTVTRVEQLADRLHVTARTLQRHCGTHLGLGPKWLIQRARVTDLLTRIDAGGGAVDWTAAAWELGFADQAHLTRTFTALVGVPPATYERRVRGVAPAP